MQSAICLPWPIETLAIIIMFVMHVTIESQVIISYKTKQDNGEEFDYTSCEPWIKSWLGHNLKNQEYFKTNQGFYLCLFKEEKPKGKLVLNPTTKLVGFCSLESEKSHPLVQVEGSSKFKGQNIQCYLKANVKVAPQNGELKGFLP